MSADTAANASASTPTAQHYDGSSQLSSSHLPPPPLVVAQSTTNPIPSAISSPLANQEVMTAPGTNGGGHISRAAPEPNKRCLYVGGLDPRITDDHLKEIFTTAGHVQSVKIIPDRNRTGLNYGFVEFDDPGVAERAMQGLNGCRVYSTEIHVNWAYQSNSLSREDTSNHYQIFVGDLSNEINDEALYKAFAANFSSISDARVKWDMKTGRSRGFGFVSFRERDEAQKALSSMNGEWLGSRAIRCNWANQKNQSITPQQHMMMSMGMPPAYAPHHNFPSNGIQSYEMVVQQTPPKHRTCYVGNLPPYTKEEDFVPLFQAFGYVTQTRLQADRGFAFVEMDSHENAAKAICSLNDFSVNNRPIKCSWGKDRQMNRMPQYDGLGAHAGFAANPAYYHQYSASFPAAAMQSTASNRGWDPQQNSAMPNAANFNAGPGNMAMVSGAPYGAAPAANFARPPTAAATAHDASVSASPQAAAAAAAAAAAGMSTAQMGAGWGQPGAAGANYANGYAAYQQ